MGTQFGDLLRQWRETRRLSQLDLALDAEVSARHVSFLETGRARPSRDMVMRLGAVLDVPRGSRNAMLNAAGFAPGYRARAMEEAEMGPIAEAIGWMLNRHMPYPAIVLDRHWTILRANPMAEMMLGQMGLAPGASMLEALTGETTARAMIENWEEVATHLIHRLRAEAAHLGGDPYLEAAAARLGESLDGSALAPDAGSAAVVPTRYRLGASTLSLFSTMSQFSTAEDIALADWRIEHPFPADAATRDILRSLAAQL